MRIIKNILPLILLILCSCESQSNAEIKLLVGTYTSTQSRGIYYYSISLNDTNKVEKLSETEINNPSFLAFDQNSSVVYSVSEANSSGSFVTSFKLDRNSGELNIINRSEIPAGPCYVAINSNKGFVVTANYGSGTISVIPISQTGVLSSASNYLYNGYGEDSTRQDMPHPHSIMFVDNQNEMLVSDLGTDRIYIYKLSEDAGCNITGVEILETPSGTGPRHMVLNKKGNRFYVIGELSGKVLLYEYRNGKPNLVQEILADTCMASGSADIHISPDEKFLYVSTRLKGDGIVTFKIKDNGTLQRSGYHATGKHPRNFGITPCGNYMFVACRDANQIEIYCINKETGLITDTGRRIDVPMPTFVTFIKPF